MDSAHFSSQLSHLSDSLNEIIRIDPFSLLPREVNLRILGYLDAISLGRAAQVSKSWKALADDDLLWRRMCGQHIDRKCEKCGWGLPLLERKRLKVELKDRSPAVMLGVGEHLHGHGHSHMHLGGVTREETLEGLAKASELVDPVEAGSVLGKRGGGVESSDTEESEVGLGVKRTRRRRGSGGVEGKLLTREVRLTRPWKTVYCERLKVERNWRKGRCTTKLLKVRSAAHLYSKLIVAGSHRWSHVLAVSHRSYFPVIPRSHHWLVRPDCPNLESAHWRPHPSSPRTRPRSTVPPIRSTSPFYRRNGRDRAAVELASRRVPSSP